MNIIVDYRDTQTKKKTLLAVMVERIVTLGRVELGFNPLEWFQGIQTEMDTMGEGVSPKFKPKGGTKEVKETVGEGATARLVPAVPTGHGRVRHVHGLPLPSHGGTHHHDSPDPDGRR